MPGRYALRMCAATADPWGRKKSDTMGFWQTPNIWGKKMPTKDANKRWAERKMYLQLQMWQIILGIFVKFQGGLSRRKRFFFFVVKAQSSFFCVCGGGSRYSETHVNCIHSLHISRIDKLFTSTASKAISSYLISILKLFNGCLIDQIHKLGGLIFFLYFHPDLGKWPNLTIIFQIGWNHQVVK